MRRLQFVQLFIALLIFAACAKPASEPALNNTCIPLVVDFAFQIKEMPPVYPTEIPLSDEWVLQSTLPESFYSRSAGVYFQGDIWLIGYDSSNSSQAVLRYSPLARTWKTYTDFQVQGKRSDAFNSLYVSPDKSLWGIMSNRLNYANNFSPPLDGLSPLSHYNEQTDSFEYSVDDEGILSTKIGEIYGFAGDKNGSIWFTNNEGLYEYIPSQAMVKTHIRTTKVDALLLLAAAPDNSIWAVPNRRALLHYEPTTNTVTEYKVPREIFISDDTLDGLSGLRSVYIDSKNRLWMEDRGWVELDSLKSPVDISEIENEVWYQVVRSPVFITDYGGAFKHTWRRPSLVFEDTNGFLWFTSLAGLVRLNSQLGEWCKVATSGTIIEDSNRNLWLIFEKGIYLYKP